MMMNTGFTPVQFSASDRQIAKQLKKEKKAAKKAYQETPRKQMERLEKKAKVKTYAKDYAAMNTPMIAGTAVATALLGPVGLFGLIPIAFANFVKPLADIDGEEYAFNTDTRARQAARDVRENFDRISAELDAKAAEKKGQKLIDLSHDENY